MADAPGVPGQQGRRVPGAEWRDRNQPRNVAIRSARSSPSRLP